MTYMDRFARARGCNHRHLNVCDRIRIDVVNMSKRQPPGGARWPWMPVSRWNVLCVYELSWQSIFINTRGQLSTSRRVCRLEKLSSLPHNFVCKVCDASWKSTTCLFVQCSTHQLEELLFVSWKFKKVIWQLPVDKAKQFIYSPRTAKPKKVHKLQISL